MLFSDPTFLLRFLPVVLGVYTLAVTFARRTPAGARSYRGAQWVLVAAGVGYLATAGQVVVALGVAAVVFNLAIAYGLRRTRASGSTASLAPDVWLTIGVTGNLLLFGLSKYAEPVASVVSRTVDPIGVFAVPQLLLPLGLPVLVLHAVSYLVEVRAQPDPDRSPVRAASYLLLFPLLVAGPVMRFRDLAPQLDRPAIGMAAFAYGVRRFVIGLAKTMLIARVLAGPADAAFATSPDLLSTANAWIGLSCFTLQVYFDFSGYTDMAVGLGRMLGLRLPENFRRPYVAETLSDFWLRWNITLVGWFRSYATAPPGDGTPRWDLVRSHLALLVLVALWHGPGWSVVAWGGLHGAMVSLEQLGLANLVRRTPRACRHLYTLLVVMVAWVVFRTETLTGAVAFLGAMAGVTSGPAVDTGLLLSPLVAAALAVGLMAAAPMVPWFSRWGVSLDALTTSALMLISTAWLFAWERGRRVAALPGARRPRRDSPDTNDPPAHP